MARTQRGSVNPVGITGLYQTSSPTAGTVLSGDLRINSGGPPNQSAKLHFDSSGHCFGGGISFGSPLGTPASTHFTIVSICASDNERSFLNFWMPTVLSICHGGIWRVITRSRIALAQGHVLVRHQRHRSHRIRPMARLAFLLQYWGDVLGESDRRVR